MTLRIAHFVSGFPILSETFVLNEIRAFAQEGFENVVVSLRPAVHANQVITEAVLVGEFKIIEVLYPRKHPKGVGGRWSTLATYPSKALKVTKELVAAAVLNPREASRLLYTLDRILEVVPALKALSINHCHAHWAHYPTDLAWGCSQILGIPLSWNAHSYDLYRYKAHLREKIRAAEWIFPVSYQNQTYLRSQQQGQSFLPPSIESKSGVSAAPPHIEVIHYGIRLDNYVRYGSQKQKATPHPRIILGVGRLVDTKGFATLIKAVALVLEKGCQDIETWIIGEGEERPHLECLINQLSLSDKVHLLGALPHSTVREHQRNACLVVQPCCSGRNGLDGIPLVLQEAMAWGIPVISTNFAAIPELITSGENGLLVEPEDPQSLAEAMLQLLNQPELQRRFAQQGRKQIEENFNAEINYRRKARIIKDYLEDGGTPPVRPTGFRRSPE